MIYFVRNKNGAFFKLDYPCFGMLAHIGTLMNASWRSDIWRLDRGNWVSPHEEFSSSWETNNPIQGFDVDDLETIYLPTYGRDIDISHPFFNRLSKGDLPDELFHNTSINTRDCITLTLVAGVPCDELFMPLFAVREIVENSMCEKVYENVLEWDVPRHLAVFFGATFYMSRVFNFNNGNRQAEDVYYPHQDDGGTFSNGKIGDLIAIMNGERPRYISSPWGSLPRGYPSYGVTEVEEDEWGDETGCEHESVDPITNRAHHMNDSLRLARIYNDEFFNTYLTDSKFNRMSEQEFRPLVMEILQHVNYYPEDQSGA